MFRYLSFTYIYIYVDICLNTYVNICLRDGFCFSTCFPPGLFLLQARCDEGACDATFGGRDEAYRPENGGRSGRAWMITPLEHCKKGTKKPPEVEHRP